MENIPDTPRWYIADVVVEFIIEDDPVNIVDINITLIRAGSPEEAYDRAISFGNDYNSTYKNTDGKQVTAVFRGLKDLTVVTDRELEDGTELLYFRRENVSEQECDELIRAKAELGVFRPRDSNEGNTRPSLFEAGFRQLKPRG